MTTKSTGSNASNTGAISSDWLRELPITTIAVYGTLKRGYGNNRLLTSWATFLGEDFVPFNKIRGTGFPIAKFHGADGTKLLKVEIFAITSPETLQRVDALEGHPQWYKRTPVVTESGKNVEIYDMASQDFEDDSSRFAIQGTNTFEWSNLPN